MNKTERMTKIVLAARDEYLRRERIRRRRILRISLCAAGVAALIAVVILLRPAATSEDGQLSAENVTGSTDAETAATAQKGPGGPYSVIEASRKDNSIVVVVEEEPKDDEVEWGLLDDTGETVPIVDVENVERNEYDDRNIIILRTEETIGSGSYLISNACGNDVNNYELPAE